MRLVPLRRFGFRMQPAIAALIFLARSLDHRYERGTTVNPASKRSVLLLVALATLAGALAFIAPVSGQDGGQAAPVFVTTIPSG